MILDLLPWDDLTWVTVGAWLGGIPVFGSYRGLSWLDLRTKLILKRFPFATICSALRAASGPTRVLTVTPRVG